MAIVQLEHNTGYGSGGDGRQATDEYTVIMSSMTELDRVTVLSASGIPAYGAAHPKDAGMFVWNKNSKRVDALKYTVEVTYRTLKGVWYPMAPGSTFTDVYPHISMTTQSTQELIQNDVNGNAIVTTTGEPIEGIMEDVNDPVITIVRNFASWSFAGVASYRNAINSDTFLSFTAGQLRIVSLSVQPNRITAGTGSTVDYFTGTVVMAARSDPPGAAGKAWWRRVLNQGYYQSVAGAPGPSGVPAVRILDNNGDPMISPTLLDQYGQPTDTAHWLYFQTRPSMAFSGLNFI